MRRPSAARETEMNAATFTARLAPSFEDQPEGERVYEVVTPEGERIASCTSNAAAMSLAFALNTSITAWADIVGSDAVVEVSA